MAFRGLDLQTCVNLESVSYRIVVVGAQDEQPGTSAAAAWHLFPTDGAILADSVAHIIPAWTKVITIRIDHAGNLGKAHVARALPWAALEDVLLERVDRGLRSVAIGWAEPLTGSDGKQAMMRGYFPRLVERGCLSFVE